MRLVVLLVAVASTAFAQQGASGPGTESQAVRQAILDYAEGYYDRAPERMSRAIAPILTKRALVVRPGQPAFLSQMNAEMLIEATRGSGPRPSAAERQLVAETLDVSGDIASGRVFSVLFNDYIHLVRRDGRWQLVSVLWHPPLPASAPASVSGAVEKASREYAAALMGTDREQIISLLSPVAAIRTLATAPSGARLLGDQNAQATAAAAAAGVMPRGNANPIVTVLGVDGNIASVKLGAGPETIYLHLALQDDRWLVVNTLQAAGPR